MKNPDLKKLHAELQNIPLYVVEPNKLSESHAEKIAAKFGWAIIDCMKDLAQANQYGQEKQTRADLMGQGLGLYLNAKRLFCSYLYQVAYESACEDQDARNRGDYDYDNEY